MSVAIRCVPEPLRSLAFGSIGASYVAVGTPFGNPARILLIQNLSNESVLFSMDGVIDHFPLTANGYLVLDISSNKNYDDGFFFSKGTTIYVKRLGIPTAGSVYVSVFYGERS